MALQFDRSTHLINVISPQTTVDIQTLIQVIRAQEASEEGIAFSKIANASGKESLGGSVSVGITVELQSPQQIKFYAGDYIAKISGGNLVGGIAGDPVAYSAGVQVLLIQSAASTVVATGGSAMTTEEHDALLALPAASDVAEYIWVDHAIGAEVAAIQRGRWVIDTTLNQMIFYGADNVTEVARFDLKDAAGSPSSDSVFERARV